MAQLVSDTLSACGQSWLRHIRQWQQAQTTQADYCRTHEISVAAFGWWKRKLANEGYFENAHDQANQAACNQTPFTEIKLPATVSHQADCDFDIQLPNDISIRLRQDYNPDALSQLIDILVNAC